MKNAANVKTTTWIEPAPRDLPERDVPSRDLLSLLLSAGEPRKEEPATVDHIPTIEAEVSAAIRQAIGN